MEVPDISSLNCVTCTRKYMQKHYPAFVKRLDDKYPSIDKFPAKVWLYIKKMDTPPVCPVCGGPTKFLSIVKGYQRCCSLKCACNLPEYKSSRSGKIPDEKLKSINTKRKATCMERYGVENPFQSREIKEKITNSLHERYGVDHPLQNTDILSKARTTLKSHYGVDSPMDSPIIKQKMIDSQISINGGMGFASPSIRSKFERTMTDRYGSDNIMHSQDFRGSMVNGHEHIISYNDDGSWVCKCPHPECNKCVDKTFITNSTIYNNRKRSGSEQCTHLLSIGDYPNKNTSLELFIQSILDEHDIEYITNSRDIIPPKELDIYIPSKKLAIECNGIYWHSDECVNSHYHDDKYHDCESKDIQLITIWGDQIINYPEKVKNMILSKLGIYDTRIYARKCIVKLIDNDICNEFLNTYHMQGSIRCAIRIGLYYNGELVSVMTFGKSRFRGKDIADWEMYRYCCKGGYQIVGGAEKMFLWFIKNYHPSKVISFSSNDISNGNLYKKLGFDIDGETIGYWWIKDNRRYHRYVFRKSELVKEGYDPSLSESQIMKSRGFVKIYDSGQTKWAINFT